MIAKYYIYAVTREEERFSETFLTFLEADLTKKSTNLNLKSTVNHFISIYSSLFAWFFISIYVYFFIFLFFCHTMYIFICKCRQICSMSGGE